MAVSKKKDNLIKRQHELDVKKWLESENIGYDLCGEFDFCVKCDKSLDNPCAAAYDAFHAAAVTAAKTAVSEKTVKAVKKPTAKKDKKEITPPVINTRPLKSPTEKPKGTTTRNKTVKATPVEEEIAATTTTRKKEKN